AAHVAVVGNTRDAAERNAAAAAMVAVAGGGCRPQRYAMKSIGEGDDVLATGDLARNLHGRFDGVRTGGAGELQAVVHVARLQNAALECFHEAGFGARVHVEPVGDAVARDVVEQRLLAHRIVVPIVQRAGTGQEVDVAFAFGVVQGG